MLSSWNFSIYNFHIHLLKPLPIIPKAPIITGIIVTFLHWKRLSIFLFNSWYCCTFSCPFSFTQVSNGYVKLNIWHFFVFLSTIMMSGLLGSSFWFVYIEKPYNILHCHFQALSLVCIHTTWFQLKICIFFTSPSKQPHQFYHATTGSTASVWAFYIQQTYDWLFPLFLQAIYMGVKHSVC